MRIIGDILPKIIEREGALIAKTFKGPVYLANASETHLTLSDGHSFVSVPIERESKPRKRNR